MGKKLLIACWIVLLLFCGCTRANQAGAGAESETTADDVLVLKPTGEAFMRICGYFYRGDNGSPLVLNSGEAYCVYNNTGNGNAFDNLNNGDYVELHAIEIRETYPAQTKVIDYVLLENGTEDNLDKEAVAQLTQMGY